MELIPIYNIVFGRNLKELSIIQNKLEEIKGLDKLINLRILNLSFNKIK
ncbi:MAG: leucine-rich repeat domain-containing protein [Candidatus Thorarchaeota archaeon]